MYYNICTTFHPEIFTKLFKVSKCCFFTVRGFEPGTAGSTFWRTILSCRTSISPYEPPHFLYETLLYSVQYTVYTVHPSMSHCISNWATSFLNEPLLPRMSYKISKWATTTSPFSHLIFKWATTSPNELKKSKWATTTSPLSHFICKWATTSVNEPLHLFMRHNICYEPLNLYWATSPVNEPLGEWK